MLRKRLRKRLQEVVIAKKDDLDELKGAFNGRGAFDGYANEDRILAILRLELVKSVDIGLLLEEEVTNI